MTRFHALASFSCMLYRYLVLLTLNALASADACGSKLSSVVKYKPTNLATSLYGRGDRSATRVH